MGSGLLSIVACASLLAPPGASGDAAQDYAYIAALSERGLHAEVAREAARFLREHPADQKADHARYRLACAYAELGRGAEAEPVFAEVSTRAAFEFAPEASHRLGEARLKAHDPEAAERAFSRALTTGRAYLVPLAARGRAEARLQRGDVPGARADFEAVLNAKPDPSTLLAARIGLAWCAYRAGDAPRVAALASELHADPTLPPERRAEVACLWAESLHDQGDPRAALSMWRSIREASQADAAARGAGFALAALGEHAAAAREFARCLAEFPAGRFAAECALHCGIERLAAGDAAAARDVLASPVLPANAESSSWRARAELESGDARAALATLDRALAQAPGAEWESRLRAARGRALESLGRRDEALAAFEGAGSIEALQSAAALRLAAGDASGAADCAQRILDRRPAADAAIPAWLARGEALLVLGHAAEAAVAFESAIDLDTDPARRGRARLRNAWCRWLAGDAAAARALADAALSEVVEPRAIEEARFLRARALEATASRAEAASAYRDQLAGHPEGSHAAEAVVRLARLVDDAEAIDLLTRTLAQAPQGSRADAARFELAERHFAARRFVEARAHYEAVATGAVEPELSRLARHGLAWCAFETGAYDAAARAAQELARASDVSVDLRSSSLELALWARVKQGDATLALAAWDALRASGAAGSNSGSALAALVDLLLGSGQVDEAARRLEALRSAAGDPLLAARATLGLARVRAAAGRLEEAEELLASAAGAVERAPELGRDVLDTAFVLGERRFDARQDARAIELYAVAASDPSHPAADRALYKLGFTRLRAQDPAGARREFARLVAEHAESALVVEARFLEGEALFRLGRFDEAIACFERVRRDAPRHAIVPKALFRLGLALARRERWAEAATVLGELARAKPDFEALPEAELWRGRALARTGDARGARAIFERVAAREATAIGDAARLEVGRADLDRGDPEAALSAFLKVALLGDDPELVPEALWLAGDALERLRQPDKARERLREIVERHATSPWAARARARLAEPAPRAARD